MKNTRNKAITHTNNTNTPEHTDGLVAAAGPGAQSPSVSEDFNLWSRAESSRIKRKVKALIELDRDDRQFSPAQIEKLLGPLDDISSKHPEIKSELAEIVAAIRRWYRQLAYHEASHAVVLFLLRNADLIKHIRIRKGGKFPARVRTTPPYRPWTERWTSSETPAAEPGLWRRTAYQDILLRLAGYAADRRFADEPLRDWIGKKIEDLAKKPETLVAGSDIHIALVVAKYIGITGRRALRIIRTLATWTEELIAIPRVWTTITALAANLNAGETMAGADARRIMRQAWGEDDEIPIRSLGKKWVRRFLPPQKNGEPARGSARRAVPVLSSERRFSNPEPAGL